MTSGIHDSNALASIKEWRNTISSFTFKASKLIVGSSVSLKDVCNDGPAATDTVLLVPAAG